MSPTDRLIQELAAGRVIPFVGSGASMAVRVDGKAVFPSWGELLDAMAEAISDGADAEIVRLQVQRKRWLAAADCAVDYLGKAEFISVMRERIDVPFPKKPT